MKTPGQLTKTQLVDLVTQLQFWFYVDNDGTTMRGDYWNPGKEVGGADTVEFVLEQIDKAGLAPTVVQKVEPWTLDELTTIFTDAAEAGHAANLNEEDGGTCNFDTCTIRLPGLVPELIEEHAKTCGLSIDYRTPPKKGKRDMWDGRYFVHIPAATGQGNRHTRVAEALDKVMERHGVDTLMYYQMD